MKGETVEMPFGPPYKPVVDVAIRATDEKQKPMVQLAMSLVGSAGEELHEHDGQRRPAAEARVHHHRSRRQSCPKGSFEYG